MRTQYKGGGTNRIKFEYRSVNYAAAPPQCQPAGQFNPSNINWNNPTVGAFILQDNRVLPQSTSAWALGSFTVASPGTGSGFSVNEGIDLRVQVYSESGGDLFVDNMEAR
jgi:hypothetical protein